MSFCQWGSEESENLTKRRQCGQHASAQDIVLSQTLSITYKAVSGTDLPARQTMLKLLLLGISGLLGIVRLVDAQSSATVTVSGTASHPIPSTLCKSLILFRFCVADKLIQGVTCSRQVGFYCVLVITLYLRSSKSIGYQCK